MAFDREVHGSAAVTFFLNRANRPTLFLGTTTHRERLVGNLRHALLHEYDAVRAHLLGENGEQAYIVRWINIQSVDAPEWLKEKGRVSEANEETLLNLREDPYMVIERVMRRSTNLPRRDAVVVRRAAFLLVMQLHIAALDEAERLSLPEVINQFIAP